MYTNSRLLQVVISGAVDGKFYRLPPDKENPGNYLQDHCQEMMCKIISQQVVNFPH